MSSASQSVKDFPRWHGKVLRRVFHARRFSGADPRGFRSHEDSAAFVMLQGRHFADACKNDEFSQVKNGR